ncbi:MAG: polysaccharide pyruvyl transferase family protein [Acidobacteriota bacterium]|nr:polysaccharide pyruvyl transferase family protein [Acidobacteriota bacterium]
MTGNICIWGTSLEKVADEAQVLSVMSACRRQFPHADIVLFMRDGHLIQSQAPDVVVFPTARLFRVLRALIGARLFVIVGGPFYEDRKQAAVCGLLIGLARAVGTPVMAYGTTLFPLTTRWGRSLYRFLFNRMAAVAMREPVCLDLLTALKVQVKPVLFADPRFGLQPASPERTREILDAEGIDPDRPYIVVTTRLMNEQLPDWVKRGSDFEPQRPAMVNKALGKTLAFLARRYQLVMIPMHPSPAEDQATASALRPYFEEPEKLRVLSRRYTAPEVMGLIGEAEAVIAGRLGSAVFAVAMGTPVTAVAYESRIIDFFNRAECGECAMDWREIDEASLLARVKEMLDHAESYRRNLPLRAARFTAEAEENRKWLTALAGT